MKQVEHPEEREHLQRLYNMSQILLVRYMLESGIIKQESDYINLGTANLFYMLAHLQITAPEVNWAELRAEVERLTTTTKDKVKLAINQ